MRNGRGEIGKYDRFHIHGTDAVVVFRESLMVVTLVVGNNETSFDPYMANNMTGSTDVLYRLSVRRRSVAENAMTWE